MNETGQFKTAVDSSVTNIEGEVEMNRTDSVDGSSLRGQLPVKDTMDKESNQRGLCLQHEGSACHTTGSGHVNISEQISHPAVQRLSSSEVSQEWDSCSDGGEDVMDAEPPATQCLPSWKLKPVTCTSSYQKTKSCENAGNNSSTASQAVISSGGVPEAAAASPDTIAGALDWIRCGASIVSSYLNWKRDGCKYSFSLPQFRDSAKLRQINTCSEVGRTRHRLPSSQRTQLRHFENVHSHDVGMHEEGCEDYNYDSCAGDSYTSEQAALHESRYNRVSKSSEMSRETVNGREILSQALLWQKPILQDLDHAPGKTESADILQASGVQSGLRPGGLSVGSISLGDRGALKSASGGSIPTTIETLQAPARDKHDASAHPCDPKFMVGLNNLITSSQQDRNALCIQHEPSNQCSAIDRTEKACIFQQTSPIAGQYLVDELVLESISSPASQTSVYGDISRLQECDMVSIALDSEATRNDDEDTVICSTPSPCSSSGGDDHSSSSSEVMQAAMSQSASACFCWLGNPRRRDGGRSRSYIKERNTLAGCKPDSQKHCKDSDKFCQGGYQHDQYLEVASEDQELHTTDLESGCNFGTKTVATENQTGPNCHYTPEGCQGNLNNFKTPNSELVCFCHVVPTQLAKDKAVAASNMCPLHSASLNDPHRAFLSFDEKRHAVYSCSDGSCNCHTHTTSCNAQNTFKNIYSIKSSGEPFSGCDMKMCNSTSSVPLSVWHESNTPDSTGDCLEKKLASDVISQTLNEMQGDETTVISQCQPAVLPVLEGSCVRSVTLPSHFATEVMAPPQVIISESFTSVLRDLTNFDRADTVTTDSRQGTSSTGEWEKTHHSSESRQKKKRMKRTLPHAGQKMTLTSSLEESDSDRNFEGSDKKTALICSKPHNRKHRSLQSSNSQSSASSPSQSHQSTQFDAQNFVQRVKERLKLVRGLASSRQASQPSSSRHHLLAHTRPEVNTSADEASVASRSSRSGIGLAVRDIIACSRQTPSWEGRTESPVGIRSQNRSPLKEVQAEPFHSSHQSLEQPGCSVAVLQQAGGVKEKEDGFGFQNRMHPATFQLKKELGAKFRSWSSWSCRNLTDADAMEEVGSSCPDDADGSFSLLTSCHFPHQNCTLKLLKTYRTWPSHLNQCLSSSSSSSVTSSLFSQSDSEESSDYESQGKTVSGALKSECAEESRGSPNKEAKALVTPLGVLVDGSAVGSAENDKKTEAAEITFQTSAPVDSPLQCGRESGLSTLYRELYDEEADSDEEWKFLARVVNIDFDDPEYCASMAKDEQGADSWQWNAEQSFSSDDQENAVVDASASGKSAPPAHRSPAEINSQWCTSKSPGRLQKRLECHSRDSSELQAGWFDSLERASSRTEPASEWWQSIKYETPRQYNMQGDTQDALAEDKSRRELAESCDSQSEDTGLSLPFPHSAGEVTDYSEWMGMTCAPTSCPGGKWPDTGHMSSTSSANGGRTTERENTHRSGLCSDEEEEEAVANGNCSDENYEGDTELDCECGGCDMMVHGDRMQVAGLCLEEDISSSTPCGTHAQASLPGSEGVPTEEQNAMFGASGSMPEFQNLPRNPRWADFAMQSMEDRHLEGAAARLSRARGGIQSNRDRQSSEDESTLRDSNSQSSREGQQALVLTGNVLEDVDLLGSFLSSHWEELSYHMSIVDRFIEAFAACLSDAPRLTDEELQRLCSFPASALEEGDTCAICLSNIQVQEMVIRLPTCCHLFHTICITKWLSTSRSCPVCRTVVQVYTSPSSPAISID